MKKTNDDDHESKRENMWSKLLELADVASKVYDEEQRKKKGKSKIVYEEEEEEGYYDRYPQETYENLNGASTSSSSLHHLRCIETCSSLRYNRAETENPPPNLSSQSSLSPMESTSRKRPAVVPQERSSNGKFKKTNVTSMPRVARETPEWVFEVMREMGVAGNPMLVFEKSLSQSDVNTNQSRLLMPFSMLTRNDFLTEAECQAIEREDIEEENIGVGTLLVNKKCEKWGLRFKIWVMEKPDSRNGTFNYTLNWGWNDVVKGNHLRAGHEISLWSFRCRGVLCFALERR
ncbi:hypothetical protein CARUB_v10007012mg, partial [Capsella rubella]